jgi:hypothetical protein
MLLMLRKFWQVIHDKKSQLFLDTGHQAYKSSVTQNFGIQKPDLQSKIVGLQWGHDGVITGGNNTVMKKKISCRS